jgi:phage-related protein
VYVLHAFQKKSKTGREMLRRDIELIKQRLREDAVDELGGMRTSQTASARLSTP